MGDLEWVIWNGELESRLSQLQIADQQSRNLQIQIGEIEISDQE